MLSSASEVASEDDIEVVEEAATAAVDVYAAVEVAAEIVAEAVVETDVETAAEVETAKEVETVAGFASDDSGVSLAGEAFLLDR